MPLTDTDKAELAALEGMADELSEAIFRAGVSVADSEHVGHEMVKALALSQNIYEQLRVILMRSAA